MHSFIHLFIHDDFVSGGLLIDIHTHPFIINPSIEPYNHPVLHQFIHSLRRLTTVWAMVPRILFIRSIIHSFSQPYNQPLIRPFINSFFHSGGLLRCGPWSHDEYGPAAARVPGPHPAPQRRRPARRRVMVLHSGTGLSIILCPSHLPTEDSIQIGRTGQWLPVSYIGYPKRLHKWSSDIIIYSTRILFPLIHFFEGGFSLTPF